MHGDWFGGKGLGVGQIDYKESCFECGDEN